MARIFRTRTRDEWCEELEGTEACVTPVLELHEVSSHPHNQARESMTDVCGELQPSPALRFTLTPGRVQGGTARADEHRREILEDWGL